jgi:hypothetical protein
VRLSSYAVHSVPREILPGGPTTPLAPLASEGAADELDPELLALPDPPRRERRLTTAILVLAAAGALAMTFALRRDVAYAFSGGTPEYLGDLTGAAPALLAAHENRLVRADAMLGAAGGIRYERPFVSDSFRALPVAGRTDLWVDVRVPAGQENGRWEPPRSVVGRLVRFGAAGPRHRGMARAIADAAQSRVPDPAWLLVDGEDPASARWVLVVALAFLGFAVGNLAAVVRIVRRVA